MPKKTVKSKTVKKSATKTRIGSRSGNFYGYGNEFVLITGGGFLVIVMAMLLFF